MGKEMGIQSPSEHVVVVELHPEPEMREEIKAVTEIVCEGADCDVVMDFSCVGIMATPSISGLLQLRQCLGECGRRLVLCNLAASTKGVFAATGLDAIFEFADDKSAALAAVEHVLQAAGEPGAD
jgi:anti-anti-sigma regulatory factor